MTRLLPIVALVIGLGLSTTQAQAPKVPAGEPASMGSNMVSPEIDSILNHRPWHHEFMDPKSPAAGGQGYRNPGNVGRTNELYQPGDKFQNDSPKHVTAKIGLGGVPDRAEQLAAFNAGTARYNALQTHMDRYGRPMAGFGMGFGFR